VHCLAQQALTGLLRSKLLLTVKTPVKESDAPAEQTLGTITVDLSSLVLNGAVEVLNRSVNPDVFVPGGATLTLSIIAVP